MCRVTLLFLFEFLELRALSLWTEFQFNEVDISILRKDLGRTKVGSSAWDRAHKESIRAALVAGRGASTIREKTVWNNS
eukprot:734359-Pelagomonas_calceolata.AAC.1